MDENKLKQWIQPGNKVREFYKKGNRYNRLWHVRAIVDDDIVVLRYWHVAHGWVYRLRDWEDLQTMHAAGVLNYEGKLDG